MQTKSLHKKKYGLTNEMLISFIIISHRLVEAEEVREVDRDEYEARMNSCQVGSNYTR